MTTNDDVTMVRACMAGDREAFGMLVDKYQKPLFNAAYRITCDTEDAMDATQSAFVKAYEKLDTFDTSRRFFSWIYRILLNESLNIVNHRRRFDTIQEDISHPAADASQHLADDETSRQIQSALMDMKTDYRVVLVLKHYQGMSYREMSEVIGVPEKTVKSRLFSARKQLKDKLLRKGIVR